MNEFINVKVEKDDVIDLLVNRVRFWTDNEDVVDLFRKMYEKHSDNIALDRWLLFLQHYM